jgi:hypothetical protein
MVQAPIPMPNDEIYRNLIAGTASIDVQAAVSDAGIPATFKALSGAFELTNDEFSERFLPWVRLAVALLQRDFIAGDRLVRDMMQQHGERCLNEADRAWTACAEVFSTITEFVEAAQLRVSIVREQPWVSGPGSPAGEAVRPLSRRGREDRRRRFAISERSGESLEDRQMPNSGL